MRLLWSYQLEVLYRAIRCYVPLPRFSDDDRLGGYRFSDDDCFGEYG